MQGNEILQKFIANKIITNEEAIEKLKTLPLPKNNQIHETGSDVSHVFDLFSNIQLANSALLRSYILGIRDEKIKNLLLLAFSGSIHSYNLTYHKGDKKTSGSDSAMMRYYRHRIAREITDADLEKLFSNRILNIKNALEEISKEILANRIEFNENNTQIIHGDATNLTQIKDESVDFIFTDPPYGAKIPYLDLSIMYNTWLNLDVSEEDRKKEIIEKGSLKKTSMEYEELLQKSISEMFRVLKWNRWLVFVFQHEKPKYWHMVLKAFEKAGFEYVATQKEETSVPSFKKNQKHFVLSGQLNLYFKKVKTPKSILKSAFKNDEISNLIFNHIEMLIAKNNGATMEEINDFIIQDGMENGYLDILEKDFPDLSAILVNDYDYDNTTKKFHLKTNFKFKTHIPTTKRIQYYLTSYLKRENSLNKYPTMDDIILYIMPMLKNGTTPEKQDIQIVLKEIAQEKNGGYELQSSKPQSELAL
jgi:DNA modification methylase